jgi:hypothetical protein
MTSSGTNYLSAGYRRIAILHGELRLTLRFRARQSERDDGRNLHMGQAAIGNHAEHGCSKECTP